jgi:hypothetical protein
MPGKPELVLAPENEPPAPPEPMPPLPPLAPHAEIAPPERMTAPAPPERTTLPAPPAWTQATPEPIPDPPSWAQPVPQPSARPPAGLRLLDEAARAAAPSPPPKPPEAPRRFALLDDIQGEMRPRRARTGRSKPGDLL